jgi:hypothetical protein
VKQCTLCNIPKDLAEFPNNKKSKDGKDWRCRLCVKSIHRAYYAKNKHLWKDRDKRLREADPEGLNKRQREAQARYRANPQNTIKLRYLRSRYGITPKDYDRMLQEQGGVCKICGSPPDGRNRYGRLHVHHCHTTGKVRGLLCYPCNVGLGSFKDDQERMAKAMAYLDAHA